MADFEPLTAQEEAALERLLRLEHAAQAAWLDELHAAARERLCGQLAAQTPVDRAAGAQQKSMLLRRQAGAVEARVRASAAARVIRVRILRQLQTLLG